jgi:hypothetical protein
MLLTIQLARSLSETLTVGTTEKKNSPNFFFSSTDEPDSPVDDSASLFNIDSSVLSSKSLGDSGVIVDHVAEDPNDQTTETKDEDHVGNNKLDTSSASSTVSSDNDTPPQPVSTIKVSYASVVF